MNNYKIKVNSEAESKEAQELFESLGYEKGACSLGNYPAVVVTTQDWETGKYCSTRALGLDIPAHESYTEITLPELRDMVNPMKEYLDQNRNYEFVLSGEKEEGFIEIPEGAYTATDRQGDVVFWDIYGAATPVRNKFDIFIDEVVDKLGAKIIWQRPTQPEELPFIDDEPKYTDDEVKYMDDNGQGRLQLINNQYAEIEQVRQNGLKFDNGKPRHSLIPKGSISSVIAVLEFGAKKYEANNWQKVDNAKERYYDAAMRHIDSWWNGEKFDQETGIHHLAHAATNLFFLKWFDDKESNNG